MSDEPRASDRRFRKGPEAARWNGGTRLDRGRVLIYMPEHVAAVKCGYVFRYRLVAEQMLGRALSQEEVVHHIDGDAANDDPQNLRIFPNQSEHARYHGSLRSADAMEKMRSARKQKGTLS